MSAPARLTGEPVGKFRGVLMQFPDGLRCDPKGVATNLAPPARPGWDTAP